MSQIYLIGNFAVMSSYVLDTRTFIEVNETLYVLVRLKGNPVNYVCEKCDSYRECRASEYTLYYYGFCNYSMDDDRWFFKDLLQLESDDKIKFIRDLRNFADELEFYYLKSLDNSR